MKFTKEDARKELSSHIVAKGEKLSLSERSINEQLDTLMTLLANEETELADFVEKVAPIFKTANANIRNDVSAGIKDYQEKNPIPTPKSTDPKPTEGEETELAKRLKALEDELNTAKAERRVSEIKRDIVAKLKDKGVKNDGWIDGLLTEVHITDGFDVDSKVDAYVKLYNKSVSDVPTDITPRGTGGGSVNKQLSDTIKEAGAIAKGMRFEPENN